MGSFIGTAGNDSLTGGALDDTFQLQQGGDDTAIGGAGADNFYMGGALTAADHIDGGDGADYVELAGDYSAGLHFAAATMTGVETVRLDAGFGYSLTLNHANVATDGFLTVDGSRLGPGDSLTVDGSNLTSAQTLIVLGGAGDDVLIGGQGANIFRMGENLTAEDRIDGGPLSGHIDLDGNYAKGVTLSSANVQNIVGIDLAAGHSYSLTFGGADFGRNIYVSGYQLGTGDTVSVDGSALVKTALAGFDGQGDDTFLGGARGDIFDLRQGGDDRAIGGKGDDSFRFDNGGLSAGDTLDGGSGTDSLVLESDTFSPLRTVVFEATTMQGIETIRISDSHYDLTLTDANVAAGATLTVTLDYSTLSFDGSAETDGAFKIGGQASGPVTLIGGAGDDMLSGSGATDTLIGGAGTDQLDGGEGADKLVGGLGADLMTGGEGDDRFFFLDAQDSGPADADRILDLAATDVIYLKGIDANTKHAGNQAFTLVHAFDGHAGELMLHYDKAAQQTELLGDTNGDGQADFEVLIDGKHASFINFVL